MPEMTMVESHADWVLVWTRMVGASDEEFAKNYFSALAAHNPGDLLAAPHAALTVPQLLNAPSLDAIEQEAVERIARGRNAGAVLHYLRKMVVRGVKEPSINKAIRERDFVLQRSGRKYGESRVKSDWREFRSVAHLWAAHTFVEFHCPHVASDASATFDAMRQDLPFFLAVAESFRGFGESWSSARQKKGSTTTLLDPTATWRPPSGYELASFEYKIDT
jgi:hypothetical protein